MPRLTSGGFSKFVRSCRCQTELSCVTLNDPKTQMLLRRLELKVLNPFVLDLCPPSDGQRRRYGLTAMCLNGRPERENNPFE